MDVLDSILERYPSGAARIQRLLYYAKSTDAGSENVKRAYQLLAQTCKSEGNVAKYKTIFGPQSGTANNNSGIPEDPNRSNSQSNGDTTMSDQDFVALATTASAEAITGVPYDAAWVEQQETMALQSREVLEHRLQMAQSQLHKESIRTAYLALAQQAAENGDLVQTFHALIRAKDYCTNRPQTTAVCLQIVSVSLAMRNLISAKDYIHKLEHTFRGSSSGNESDHVLVLTASALERMGSGMFSDALRSLMQVVQHDELETAFQNAGKTKHKLLYWVSPHDLSMYTAFLCLLHGSNTEMLALADHVSALEWVPVLKQALVDFTHAKYQDCWNCVSVTLLPQLSVDPYLGPRLNTLIKGIRRKILQSYWRAYSRVPLAVMAKDLGASLVPSVDALRQEWIDLILEQQQQTSSFGGDLINTRLDMATDTLLRDDDTSPSLVQAAKLQDLTKSVLDDSYSMVVRLACQEADIMVVSPGGGSEWRRGKGGRRRGPSSNQDADRMIMDDLEDEDDDDDILGAGDTAMVDEMNPEDLY